MQESPADRPDGLARRAWHDGMVAITPLMVGVAPFGLIFGVTAAGSAVGAGLGYASSIIIFGGAAQLAMVRLIDVDAAIATIVITGLVINSRHMMYSAALTPAFRAFPRAARWGLPYVMTDQAFAVSITRYEDAADPVYRRWFFAGAGISMWVLWQITSAAGVLIGAQLPERWSLDFAVPLVFLALLAVAIKGRATAVAAVVGGVAAVLAQDAPYQLWMIIGAVCGIVAGMATERWAAR